MPAVFPEGEHLRAGDKKMIQYPDIQRQARLVHAPGQLDILPTGAGRAARMVVEQDQSLGVHLQRPLHQVARIDRRAVDGALKENLGGEMAMLLVGEDRPETLHTASLQQQAQMRPDGLGPVENGSAGQGGSEIAHLRLPDQGQKKRPSLPHTLNLPEFCGRGIEDAGQGAEHLQQPLGQRFHINARNGIGEQQLQHLIIMKALAAAPGKALPQPPAMTLYALVHTPR